ncbi:2,3-bisphosphoglycerate-independent phosphoglycerate mutase [Candidatus Woesearchaeota archaeon]|nr:2,3-bisphosphoglycerate-independent phosphoglycerate mutase [Candidatus Woesearchaeota archaeon]
MGVKKRVALIILDGMGFKKSSAGNAVLKAKMPFYRELLKKYPHTLLDTSGEAVGLPKGTIGNSEVGHLTLGSGRVIEQDLVRINNSIKDTSFFKNETLIRATLHVKRHSSALHLMGLLSDGGVHSHIGHLIALLEFAKKQGIKRVYVHAFLDGRDVPPKSAGKYIKIIQDKMDDIGVGELATMIGRYYAMDRDNRWSREKKGYNCVVNGIGKKYNDAFEALHDNYTKGITDEFLEPTILHTDSIIEPNDSVIFFNFRSDRARQLSRAFVEGRFDKFKRPKLHKVHFYTLTRYSRSIRRPVAFPPGDIKNTLGEVLAKNKLKQFRLAETEKYAHVTYFFNGGKSKPNRREKRKLINSPKVATYNLKPEMSLSIVEKYFLKAIGKADVFIVNFANPDMVGHTGMMEPTVSALQRVDEALSKVVPKLLKKNYDVLLTADHGNAEELTGEHQTSHTNNPVRLIFISDDVKKLRKGKAGLSDVSPTILDILCLPKPKEMTGDSLINS